ncbi:hypothetical protein [Achromobacter animicus]|uniref:hypothetical protein n=1 Tax=Achromobacter animicus TaxID=1389935 RepID=UPI0028AA3B14|nr:hypothetical protein [Achromobacter animicus]
MKTALAALSLTLCSVAAWADPVPAFVLQCKGTEGHAVPMFVKWDGKRLDVDVSGAGKSAPMTDPQTQSFSTLVNEKSKVARLLLSFHGKSPVSWKERSADSKDYNYVTLHVFMSGKGDVVAAFVDRAALDNNVLVRVERAVGGNCVTTLGL